MSSKILCNLSIILSMLVLIGCGADSDLLRDDNVGEKPKGLAYKTLNSKIYKLKKIDLSNIGFEYLSVNDDCTQESCSLLKDTYALFNDETNKLAIKKSIILSANGWYEKSQHEECSLEFNGNKLTEHCSDGRESTLEFSETSLEGLRLDELDNSVITQEELKDPKATFTHNTILYEVKQKNTDVLYTIENSDTSKCYEDICTIDGIQFDLKQLNAQSGSLDTGSWTKTLQHENYEIIELNTTVNDKKYFIAPYNGYTWIGEIVPKQSVSYYINTQAFNVVYAQLRDEYKASSGIYQELEKIYFRLGVYANKKWSQQLSVNIDKELSIAYRDFSNNEISDNWILSQSGFKRESLVCDSQFYYNSFKFNCEDGRSEEFIFLNETSLENDLIYHHLKEKKLDFPLYDKDEFFSVNAKKFTFKHKNNLGTNYIFNVAESFDIGTEIFIDDASSFNQDLLFISTKNKSAYMKIKGIAKGTNGTATLLDVNGTQIDSSIQWKKVYIGDRKIIYIKLNGNIEHYFTTQKSIVLMEFELSSKKVVSGFANYEDNETIQEYINIQAYEDILNNLE